MDNFVCARSRMVNLARLSSLPADLGHKGPDIPADLAQQKGRGVYRNRASKSAAQKGLHSSISDTALKEERKHTVHTQTPLTELAYEFDAAFYNFKETVRRTVPATRPHHRVYLPTIIDTKPRSRRSTTTALMPAQPPALPLPLCTCRHRQLPNKPRHRALGNHVKKHELEQQLSNTDQKLQYHVTPRDQKLKYRLSPRDQPLQYHVTPAFDHVTPVLAVAIRRHAQDKDPIVEFNGIVGLHANRIAFTPFVRHVSTQTVKSNVHVQFEIPDVN